MPFRTQPSTLEDLCELVWHRVQCDAVLVTEADSFKVNVIAGHGNAFVNAVGSSLQHGAAICHHTVEIPVFLAIENAFQHPLVKYTDAVKNLGIGSYLGARIDSEGPERRCICALGRAPHVWVDAERALIVEAAKYANEQLSQSKA